MEIGAGRRQEKKGFSFRFIWNRFEIIIKLNVGFCLKERHEPICSKVSNKKKRVFNSYKQRAAGTGISSVRGPSVAKMPLPVSHWKQQHEDFINTIRSARLATDAVKKGLPLPPPPPASINPDYIECPYCNRRFNETAAERHINFCKTNVNRKVVARQAPVPSSIQPRPPPPPAQVQLASKQLTSPAAGPPSRGKLTAAAQAVMGVRAGLDTVGSNSRVWRLGKAGRRSSKLQQD
ncbi:zinc finger C2HC domain-containing protein 1B-like [Stegostoma tigrinum]|uniref:zinc finger C2HC domain-containing protein 1B-like n=1 Tax=Stegostoma tigrinum TaxID=3053191 RepID=UPI0028703967|nr:zinc finger C2HC domain-containing protein 1B-like [Stegostoma tigrinum]